MSYSSQWHLSIILLVFGRIYWSSQEVSFGYFNPQEYGLHTVSYFNKINISAQDVIGYLNPTSRRFIPHPIFAKGKKSTFFIKALEKQHRRSNLIKGAIAAPFLVIILFALSNGSSAPAPNTYTLQMQPEGECWMALYMFAIWQWSGGYLRSRFERLNN